MKTVTLDISGMTCAACVGRVERGLKKVEGVEEANVNLATERASVTYDPAKTSAAELVAKVVDTGYDAPTAELSFPVGGMTCAASLALIRRIELNIGENTLERPAWLIVMKWYARLLANS